VWKTFAAPEGYTGAGIPLPAGPGRGSNVWFPAAALVQDLPQPTPSQPFNPIQTLVRLEGVCQHTGMTGMAQNSRHS
jgi:hypothetical protein